MLLDSRTYARVAQFARRRADRAEDRAERARLAERRIAAALAALSVEAR